MLSSRLGLCQSRVLSFRGALFAPRNLVIKDEIRARHLQAEQIILYLDNARYNHARVVSEHIDGTNVELVFLSSYAPNLNLIERLWRFAKDKVMSNTYYETFEQFIAAFDQVLSHLDRYADELATLMTEKFEILACG